MIRHPFYLVYGVLLAALTSWLQFRGTGDFTLTEQKVVPKSIRDNPGAWRSHYGSGYRHFGGK
jgi:hypothetical protein